MSNLQAALDYAAHGFAVVPVNTRRGRKVLYSNDSSRAWRNATTDADTIEKWWSGKWADDGIACRIPLGLVYVEIDASNGGNETAKAYGLDAVIETHTDTRHDGRGFWFRVGEIGRGLLSTKLGAGIDVFFENHNNVVVMPLLGTQNAWQIADAPECITELAERLQAARRGKRSKASAIEATTPIEAPSYVKRNYAEIVLANACDALRAAPSGSRHDAILEHARRVGAVLHLGLERDRALDMLTDAISHYKDARDDARSIEDSLDFGAKAPYTPKWRAGEVRRQFQEHAERLFASLAQMQVGGMVDYAGGKCRRMTMNRVMVAVWQHFTDHGLFGVAFCSRRNIQLAGDMSTPRTIERGRSAAIQAGFMRRIDRRDVAWLRKHADKDRRGQAFAYAFDLARLADAVRAGQKDTRNADERGGSVQPGAGQDFDQQVGANTDPGAPPIPPPLSSVSGVLLSSLRLATARAAPGQVGVLQAIAVGADTLEAVTDHARMSSRTCRRHIDRLISEGVIVQGAGGGYDIDVDSLNRHLAEMEHARLDGRGALAQRISHERQRHDRRIEEINSRASVAGRRHEHVVTSTETTMQNVITITSTEIHATPESLERLTPIGITNAAELSRRMAGAAPDLASELFERAAVTVRTGDGGGEHV